MRDFDFTPDNLMPKERTELQIQKKQQIERELIGHIIPHSGHTVWEINIDTEEIEKAMSIEKDWHLFSSSIRSNNKEILYREGYAYVSALNKKNALKKFRKGMNGSKDFTNTIDIKLF